MAPTTLGDVALVYSEDYLISLGGLEKLHPFDIKKYARIVERLEADGIVRSSDYYEPTAVPDEIMRLVHEEQYLQTLSDSRAVSQYLEAPVLRALPDSTIESGVVAPFRFATGGTILGARRALEAGIAINIGGGYHHAKPETGEGFNIFNDMAVAIRVLEREGLIDRALVVDLDVHQGNGTAVCFEDDDDVFTFSIHQDDIYPIPKEKSDLDVEVSSGTGDAWYMATLQRHWDEVLAESRPDIVFYQAGCDVLEGDPLASLAMSHDGVVARDAFVIDELRRRDIPVVMLLGGGYSKNAWRAQYRSIRQIVETYDRQTPRYEPRKPRKLAR